MTPPRRMGALAGALAVVFLAGCMDSESVGPEMDFTPSSLSHIDDGSSGGNPDFFFLTPLADKNPSIVGEFNPNLLPSMRVCRLVSLGGVCATKGQGLDLAVEFAPGSATVGSGQYQISWDTDGKETGKIFTDDFYRLEILVGGEVMGHIDLDPQDPNGPGQSDADAYAFRLGETIPVKFWLSTQVLCNPEAFVTECITGAVVDQQGASLVLEDLGPRLALDVEPNSLPASDPVITVVVERIDPAAFLAQTGEECIPFFDAPQVGSCFRVTTFPELTDPLVNPAVVSLCIDPNALGVDPAQRDELTIVRFDGPDNEWEALEDAPVANCPVSTAGLVPEPESGLLRYAALGINAVARFLGPQPVFAKTLTFAGSTSSFSRFRYALPGQMLADQGNGAIIQDGEPNDVTAVVKVIDRDSRPVEGAVVHFTTSDGTLSAAAAVSDASGLAPVTWSVDISTTGAKTLTASAFGLRAVPIPETGYFIAEESIAFTATVVGPAASITKDPETNLEGTAGESVGTVTITVVDENGNAVSGAGVSWTPSGDGSTSGGETTGSDGSASTDWTLSTTAGGNTLTATVGNVTVTFTATGAAGPAVQPTFSQPPASADAGLTLDNPLSVTVTDQFGNVREGDAVTWTVTSGGGSLSGAAALTGADGSAQATWTLGEAAGTNVASVQVQGFTGTFTVQGVAGAAVQPTGSGSGQTGVVGQALASPLTVTVTDQFGNPRVGEAVTWSGDGLSATGATGADGVVSTTWTLPTTPTGATNATASVAGFTVDFTATAVADVVANLNASQDKTADFVGKTVALSISVTDQYGNARGGDAVTWSLTQGSGSVTGDAATAADGSASGTLTLGLGVNTATVEVGGVNADFTATGNCFDGFGAASVDGTLSGDEWACALSRDFTANVSGGGTDARVLWMNDDSKLYLAVQVRQPSLDKVNDIRFDFDNDGDGITEELDDAIGYVGGAFIDEYLTSKCLNRSQSGCGASDASTDGAGAVGNDGTWTTFELSHPLSGDANGQDFVRSVGQQLGFFLTLQQGNGAQGNTQVPGFREYWLITIVGF